MSKLGKEEKTYWNFYVSQRVNMKIYFKKPVSKEEAIKIFLDGEEFYDIYDEDIEGIEEIREVK